MKSEIPYYIRAYTPTGKPKVFRGSFCSRMTARTYKEQLHRFGFRTVEMAVDADGGWRVTKARRR